MERLARRFPRTIAILRVKAALKRLLFLFMVCHVCILHSEDIEISIYHPLHPKLIFLHSIHAVAGFCYTALNKLQVKHEHDI